MCKQCASWGWWAEPDSALGIFFEAVRSMPREFPEASEIEQEFPQDTQAQAAWLLTIGEYPDDEDDEDSWDEYEQARRHRDDVAHAWLRSADDMIRLATTVKNYPWLGLWAEQFVSSGAEYSALLRRWMIELIPARSLVRTAAAKTLTEPELPCERTDLVPLGSPSEVEEVLRRAWSAWQSERVHTWADANRGMRARSVLHGALGRKRNGREAALAAIDEIVSDWESRATAVAAAGAGQPAATLTVSVEGPWARPYDGRAPGLTPWETGVLVHWAKDFDWAQAEILLEVPQLVADQVRAGGGAFTEIECIPGDPEETPAAVAGGLVPGVLDDAPVSARIPATVQQLDALSGAGAWLFHVWSIDRGVEVLPVDTIRSRTLTGWSGIIVAGPGDLPDSLVDPWSDDVLAVAKSEEEPDPLGLLAGEVMVARRSGRRGNTVRALRLLALARSASDLRVLGESDARVAGEREVWQGLLANRRLDLTPFRPPSEDPWKRGGLELPLSALGGAQIYSTSLGGEGIKGHSPSCSHAHAGWGCVDMRFELATVRELVSTLTPDWCSKCDGYAIRRLDDRQLRIYRTAHVLMDVNIELAQRESKTFGSSLSASEHEEIHDRLRGAEFGGDDDSYEDQFAWSRTLRALGARVDRLLTR
ncbi:hypothetical protein VA596_38990 [Amycolatopsis sp., V23-08]|uniref:Uncharacterized protein n=1 Tax=Amycolatopsis heterodermiae TaxID=3110235 RepID=A0ABU5RH21_9PSEU|nr:hypothetical protein [Amycolatopsis sp., V23-08]MEA5365566.1 hypothetical protein [Amycolatopsis sp., V23-08]